MLRVGSRQPLPFFFKSATKDSTNKNQNAIIMKKNFLRWMRRNNMTFSAVAGETFTNAEVVYTNIGLVAFLIVMGLTGGH